MPLVTRYSNLDRASYPQVNRIFCTSVLLTTCDKPTAIRRGPGAAGLGPWLTSTPKMLIIQGSPPVLRDFSVYDARMKRAMRLASLCRGCWHKCAKCHWHQYLPGHACPVFVFLKRDQHETYLPTFRCASQAHPRFPCTYGYPWRPSSPERTPCKGPQASGCISHPLVADRVESCNNSSTGEGQHDSPRRTPMALPFIVTLAVTFLPGPPRPSCPKAWATR